MKDGKAPALENEAAAQYLVQTVGISEQQAHRLVDLLGTDRGSLVREARLIKAEELKNRR